MKTSLLLLILGSIAFISCSPASNPSSSDRDLYKQSRKFAKYLWYDNEVQEEYNAYTAEAPEIGKYRMNKWYNEHQHCRSKKVKLLDVKELRPGWKTFLYRVKLTCGDKVLGITYKPVNDTLIPYSIRSIDYASYGSDSFFNPAG